MGFSASVGVCQGKGGVCITFLGDYLVPGAVLVGILLFNFLSCCVEAQLAPFYR